jgi:hypothetical protein
VALFIPRHHLVQRAVQCALCLNDNGSTSSQGGFNRIHGFGQL